MLLHAMKRASFLSRGSMALAAACRHPKHVPLLPDFLRVRRGYAATTSVLR